MTLPDSFSHFTSCARAREAKQVEPSQSVMCHSADCLPSPNSRSLKNTTIESDQPALQLRWFANDCEERARVLHQAANEAKSASISGHLASNERRAVLDDLRDRVRQVLIEPRETETKQRFSGPLEHSPTDDRSVVPPTALKTSELAARFGLSERGARKAIERAMGNGREGFGRIGGLLFAEPEAFARVIRKRAQPPPA